LSELLETGLQFYQTTKREAKAFLFYFAVISASLDGLAFVSIKGLGLVLVIRDLLILDEAFLQPYCNAV
jgi:hypothetical protein